MVQNRLAITSLERFIVRLTPKALNVNTLIMAVALTFGLTGPQAYAQTPPAKPKQMAATTGLKVSTLDGKFSFTLPDGYVASAMSPGDAKSGTAGSSGTLYSSEKSRRVVIVTQLPTPNGVVAGDNDSAFLTQATSDFVTEQSKQTPDFKKTAQKQVLIKKLGVSRVDSSATLGGGPTLSTTFIAGSGTTLSEVQVVSRADDQSGHETMVKRILAGQ